MRELWDLEMLSRVIPPQYRKPLVTEIETLRGLFSGVIEKGAGLLEICNRIDTALGDIDRIGDQLKAMYEFDLFERPMKLLRRYAKWLRLEAERRIEPEPESS